MIDQRNHCHMKGQKKSLLLDLKIFEIGPSITKLIMIKKCLKKLKSNLIIVNLSHLFSKVVRN